MKLSEMIVLVTDRSSLDFGTDPVLNKFSGLLFRLFLVKYRVVGFLLPFSHVRTVELF